MEVTKIINRHKKHGRLFAFAHLAKMETEKGVTNERMNACQLLCY